MNSNSNSHQSLCRVQNYTLTRNTNFILAQVPWKVKKKIENKEEEKKKGKKPQEE